MIEFVAAVSRNASLERDKLIKEQGISFSAKQKDFICYQVGEWYLRTKDILVNEDGTTNIGCLKELLKIMLCGDYENDDN
jgi:hypothetical protein